MSSEIAYLENELDRIYALVVQGAGSIKSDIDSSDSGLASLLEKARVLKDQLRDKRSNLSRIEREVSRKKRIQQTIAGQLSSAGESREVTRVERETPSTRSNQRANVKTVKAIARAMQRLSRVEDSDRIVFEKILQDIQEDDAELQRMAAVELGTQSGQLASIAFDVLVTLLDDSDTKVRSAALNSLTLLADESSVKLFRRFVNDPNHHLRLAALRGLARIGGLEDTPILIDALDDELAIVRKAAATYLGWQEAKQATRPLTLALNDEDENVRVAVTAALASIRDERAVLSLMRAMKDKSKRVRESAKSALEAILDENLDINIDASEADLGLEIEKMTTWWKTARVEKRLGKIKSTKSDQKITIPGMPPDFEKESAVSDEHVPKGEQDTTRIIEKAKVTVDEATNVVELASMKAFSTKSTKPPRTQKNSDANIEPKEKPDQNDAAAASDLSNSEGKESNNAQNETVAAEPDEEPEGGLDTEVPSELDGLGNVKKEEQEIEAGANELEGDLDSEKPEAQSESGEENADVQEKEGDLDGGLDSEVPDELVGLGTVKDNK